MKPNKPFRFHSLWFSVEEYDPVKDEWRLVASMNVNRSRVALCANMGKLWAIGGYDGESNLSTVSDLYGI